MTAHLDVARNWLKQTGKGQNGHHMFYRGSVIYSYGTHWPLAKLSAGHPTLVNSRTHSISTAKHASIIRRVLGYSGYISVPIVNPQSERDHKINLLDLTARAEECRQRALRRRVPSYAESDRQQADALDRDAELYRATFEWA